MIRKYDAEHSFLQQKFKEILQKQDELQSIIRDDFLQQNGFTDEDFMCPSPKPIGMMKALAEFHEAVQKTMS